MTESKVIVVFIFSYIVVLFIAFFIGYAYMGKINLDTVAKCRSYVELVE